MFVNNQNSNIPSRPKLDATHRYTQLKEELHRRLIDNVDLMAYRSLSEEQLRREFRLGAEELCRHQPNLLSESERKRLIDELLDEVLGLGPLEPLLRDADISDILVNGPRTIYVERAGRLERTSITFRDEEHLLHIVQKIVGRVGRRIDESSPMADARLPDGSRVNAIIRPLALDGALLSIRRFGSRPLDVQELVAQGSATLEMLSFLSACIGARLNVLVSGGTGTGKTTLLNVLSSFIPTHERLATIEDAAELQLQQPHVARMETRPANLEGTGEISTRDLLRNALRMRPDRIIIGECRGAEAFDMLQAMNTGHEGSLTTIHANSARDALDRLAMLVGLAGSETPLWFVERQIASTVHVVVQLARLSGGVRKVVQIAEIQGWNGREVEMHDLFHYEQTGIEEDGLPRGTFHITGQVPKCLAKLRARGYLFSDDWFIRKCTTQGNRSDTHFPASSKASPDSNSLPLESAAPVSA